MLPFEAAAAELKTKLQVNLNPCHTNEWDIIIIKAWRFI